MNQQKISEIIQNLKKVREENGISYKRVVELVEENGEFVSLSTVRRVFEEGSEAYGFQYEKTLKPIAEAVFGVYKPSVPATADEADGMKAMLDYKADRIEQLEAHIKRIEESYKRRIDFLRHQIELKDDRIDRRDVMIEKLIEAMLEMKG